MLQHDRQDKAFLICQVAHQPAVKVGKIGQKAADSFTLAGPIGFAQHRIRAFGEPVYQRVQRVVVGIQHLEPPCDAGFQPGKLRETGDELCVWPLAHAGFGHGHALKCSANMRSNWLRAANHSRMDRSAFLEVSDGEVDQLGGGLLGRE